jgi:cell wall-associated NlpC family hydrolase
MADSFDKRVTAARPDLAAAHLRGLVDAPRFVEGEAYGIRYGRISLHQGPGTNTEQVSELLFGEVFTVYDLGPGMVWGQAKNDGYVGYLSERAIGPVITPNAHVTALMAPVFFEPNIKAPVIDFLPLNSAIEHAGFVGEYACLVNGGRFVHQRHIAPEAEKDFVAIAERFLGVPYVWGGKTAVGLDCSGLIQTALQAVGKAAPRDTDMMEKALGDAVATASCRGDLIFWKGHMGVMLDEARLLHANAFHMAVAIEPLTEAMARIEKIAGPVTSIKRL